MKPSVTVITLGVDDLDRALKFYRDGLGLPTPGIIGTEWEHGAVVFIDLQSGLKLSLWPRKSLAHDSGLPVSPRSPTEFSLGHNRYDSSEAGWRHDHQGCAEDLLGRLRSYFPDPHGHLW